MTALVAGLLVVLAVVLGGYAGAVGGAAASQVRSQTAADAAALAAVWESSPYGGGDPRSAAERFARMNGARLIECDCERGAIEMEVRVAGDGVEATARALLDVELLQPAPASSYAVGLDPRLAGAVDTLVRAAGGAVTVTSGWRSPERQSELWERALQEHGTPEAADDWVARPGSSMHERGLAVDLGGDLGLAARLIRELHLPLRRPMSWEPWHFELAGGPIGK